MVDLHLLGGYICLLWAKLSMSLESLVEHSNNISLRCQNMSFPEKQAREAWASRGDQNGEEEGDEDEKEPALVERV